MKRRLIIAGVAFWVLVVFGLAYYSLRTDEPTAREQSTIADALPTVDEALARVAAALRSGGDGADAIGVLSPYHQISGDCRVTTFRDGARYERVLTAYSAADAEPALLDRVAAALPGRYRISVRHGAVHTMTVDAGNFVVVRGAIESPGRVRFAADTGCRPKDRPVREAADGPGDRAPAQAALDALGLGGSQAAAARAPQWRSTRLACPGGAPLWTVEATVTVTGAPPDLVTLGERAAQGAAVVVNRPEVYAYRSGSTAVVARRTGTTVTVSSTTSC